MKILILSPFFFPEKISTGKYNTELAIALREKGHSVDVISSHPLYPDWKPQKTREKIKGIAIYRSGSWLIYPSPALLRRFILEAWYASYVFFVLVKKGRKYDLVINIFPPNLAAIVTKILTKKSCKHIGIVHDIQSVMLKAKNNLSRRIALPLIKLLEGSSYRKCDSLIFLSQEMLSSANSTFQLKDIATTVCYPFITLKDESFKNIENKLGEVLSSHTKKIVYSGAIGEKQSPEKLMKLLRQVIEIDASIKVHIFSQGKIFDHMKNDVKNANINFHPLVSLDDLPELLKKSTVQIIPQEVSSSDGAFPSKLPNILAANCKIFSVTAEGSELSTILRSYSKSLIRHTWDDPLLASELIKFTDRNISDNEKDKDVLDLFKIGTLVSSILKEITPKK